MAPTTPANHKFLPLILNKKPNPKLARNEEIPAFKITYIIIHSPISKNTSQNQPLPQWQ